jgi:hypothetical protein
VATIREVGGVSAGAAHHVDGVPGRQPVHYRDQLGLVHGEERVVGGVVRRRPDVVPLDGWDRCEIDPVAERLGAVEELANLADPVEGELAPMLAGERLHQRHPLESEKVGERVLVDGRLVRGHASTLRPADTTVKGFEIEPVTGVEPATSSLQERRSTN